MKQFLKKTHVVAAAAVMTVSAWMLGAAEAADPIKIGIVADLSGPCGALTDSEVKAIKLAVEEVNKGGGVLGRPYELVIRDSKTKPDEGAKVARDLVVTDKVNILTGVCSSAVVLAVSPVAKEYKIPFYTTIGATQRPNYELWHPYYVQLQANALMEALAAAEYAATQPWKKIVTIGLDYEWGHMTVEQFEKRLKALKPDAQIVKTLWPKLGETNMTSYITAALAEKPDMVFAVTFGGATNNLIKQGKSYGLLQQTKLFAFLPVDTLKALANDLPDGVHGFGRAPLFALNTDKAKAFGETYRAVYNDYPDDWAVMGYEGIQFLTAAIKEAGSVDADKIMAAMTSIRMDVMRGELKVRKLDGNAYAPTFVGVTKKTAEYPFPILVDIKRVEGEKVMPTPEEVEAMRKASN
ncbi:ABC transporter substrate-binding protein [Microvirga sp. G4-2]|uniref:ABC transporter substrate-binding protein n=1 Tax=Microvirga sp. G4-2 TaxID=3434467 RepID=UPI00404446DD